MRWSAGSRTVRPYTPRSEPQPVEDLIRALVDAAPPLTEEQLAKLRRILTRPRESPVVTLIEDRRP